MPTISNDRFGSSRSLDKNYLNQFKRETSQMSMTLIPCEFCNDFFASSELLKHQVSPVQQILYSLLYEINQN